MARCSLYIGCCWAACKLGYRDDALARQSGQAHSVFDTKLISAVLIDELSRELTSDENKLP